MHIFEGRGRRFLQGRITFQARRFEIGLQDIHGAIRVIREQLRVLVITEVASPYDALRVYICSVPHPFVLKNVMRRITDKEKQLAGNTC